MTDSRRLISVLDDQKAQIVMAALRRAQAAHAAATDAEATFRALVAMAQPAEANTFDADTMGFYYDPAREIELRGATPDELRRALRLEPEEEEDVELDPPSGPASDSENS